MNLVDTSVILPCLWRTTRQSYLELLEKIAEDEAPGISVITRFEVLAGTVPEFVNLNTRFLDGFLQVEVTKVIADFAGRLFYDWSKKGHTLTANDLFIGASAVIGDAVLVTRNAKHFPYLRKLNEYLVTYESRKKTKIRETICFLAK